MERFAWTLRVSSTGQGQATAYVRAHQVAIGLPVYFDEQYDQVTALEYVLAALGADLVTGFEVLARKRRMHVEHVEAVVIGELNNALTHLSVVGEDGHPGLEQVTIRVYVGSEEDEEQLRQVWHDMLRTSPLARTFSQLIALDMSVVTVM
jgi:hypothetical protein